MKLTVKETLMLELASSKLKEAKTLTDQAEKLMGDAMARTVDAKLKQYKLEQEGGGKLDEPQVQS